MTQVLKDGFLKEMLIKKNFYKKNEIWCRGAAKLVKITF